MLAESVPETAAWWRPYACGVSRVFTLLAFSRGMADDDVETITVSIDTDEDADAIELPSGLVDVLAEQGQSPAAVVGDITLLSFASRAHHLVHHGEDDNPELEAIEAETMDLFEERFGVTFGEATGHQH
jgi:hypothetical protein